MPELPEVETVVRDLRPHLVGRHIHIGQGQPASAAAPWSDRLGNAAPDRPADRCEVRRRGKWIVIALDGRSSSA